MSKQKSSIPVRHGFPNPAYGQALNFVRSIDDYRVLIEQVRAAASQQQGDLDFARLMQDCDANGVKSRLRELFDQHQATPKVNPVMGPPPAPVELYGRFAKGTSIVDIGSGNCMKLRKATGYLTVTAVDPLLDNQARLVLNAIQTSLADYLGAFFDPQTIFTSFMALPQIKYAEWAPIVECDGVHVVPDHRMLLANKIAVVQQDGMLRVRTGVGDYYDHSMDLPGVPSEPGYMFCATFALREIRIVLENEQHVDYRPVIDASPAGFYDLNFLDITPKFDGVAHELEVYDGVAHLVDRAGRQRTGTCDAAFHFCVHLEELAECYTLIRIVAWRGIIYPHHGDVLRQFATRVSLYIDGKPLLAPPRWDGTSLDKGPLLTWRIGYDEYSVRPPVDGVISRENGRDVYCKMMWTVDVFFEAFVKIKAVLASEGYEVLLEGSPYEGLYECGMSRTGSLVTFRPLKPRVDKLQPTTTDTILYLVDRPTLGETRLITESTCNV